MEDLKDTQRTGWCEDMPPFHEQFARRNGRTFDKTAPFHKKAQRFFYHCGTCRFQQSLSSNTIPPFGLDPFTSVSGRSNRCSGQDVC